MGNKYITDGERIEQLILSVEENLNGRPLLSFVINERYSVGERECKERLGWEEECESTLCGGFNRMPHIALREQSSGWMGMSHSCGLKRS